MNLETIRELFPEILFSIEKDGEVFEICEPCYMSFPYKSIKFVPDYEQYFNGVKIGLFFFPFYRNNPTKKVTGWLIDEIIEWSSNNDLIIDDSNDNPFILDGTFWSLRIPAGDFIVTLRKKFDYDFVVRNCDGVILPPPPPGYCFDSD